MAKLFWSGSQSSLQRLFNAAAALFYSEGVSAAAIESIVHRGCAVKNNLCGRFAVNAENRSDLRRAGQKDNHWNLPVAQKAVAAKSEAQ